MVTRRGELIGAGRVKEILEHVTGKEYTLKTRGELMHPDNIAWYLHLPVGKPGYIRRVYEADGKVVLESSTLYEVYQDMEHAYSEDKYLQLREKLGSDVGRLQNREVRAKYSRMMPQVVRFFDKIDEILSKVSKERGVHLSLLNSDGAITLSREIGIRDVGDDSAIKSEIRAMNEAVGLVADWQAEEQRKNLRLVQT
jgi:hypothetical protein